MEVGFPSPKGDLVWGDTKREMWDLCREPTYFAFPPAAALPPAAAAFPPAALPPAREL